MKTIQVYNGAIKEFEKIRVDYNGTNTTWFHSNSNEDVHMITDTKDGLVINDLGDYPPMLIPGKTRADCAKCGDGDEKEGALILRANYY